MNGRKMFRTGLWIVTLAAGCLGWGFAMSSALNGPPQSIQEGAGLAVGMGGFVFATTGIFAAIAYAFMKSINKALRVWTGLILAALILAGIGVARMVRG
jgi:hypothetical protein